jgi:phosphatidylethanolamine-binding protein (PEBP) family uncharacterized protein
MGSIIANTIRRIAISTAVLTIPVMTGFAGGVYARGDTDLTLSSPAFPDGTPIPVDYACPDAGGQDILPPLAWSAPGTSHMALVMDDMDSVPTPGFVHWVVVNFVSGPASTAPGETPLGGQTLVSYEGPCPPPGSGMHQYRFILYEVPANVQLAGMNAAAIARASTSSVTLTGTYGPL